MSPRTIKILHQNAPEWAYRFFVFWVFGIWFFYSLFDPVTSLAYLPQSLYVPTGFLLKFLPPAIYYWPISFYFLLALKVLLLFSLASVILGFYKKWMALLACVLLTVFEGLVRSFGHINHPELALVLMVFVLTIFFFFEDSLDDRTMAISKYGIPLMMALFVVCFTYCFTGIHRLVARGLDIYMTNTMSFWVMEEGKRSRLFNWHLENLMLTSSFIHTMMTIGFPLVTFCEVASVFCLVSRRFRYIWLLIMVPFHLMVWIFMGIFFWANLALYVLFFDFARERDHE